MKLIRIDDAFNVVRHITSVSVNSFTEELTKMLDSVEADQDEITSTNMTLDDDTLISNGTNNGSEYQIQKGDEFEVTSTNMTLDDDNQTHKYTS